MTSTQIFTLPTLGDSLKSREQTEINERALPNFGLQINSNRLETEKLLVQDRDTLVFSWHDENKFIKKIGGTYSDSDKTVVSFSSTKSPSPNHTGTVVSSHWINSNTVTTGRTEETPGVSPSINSRETITFEK